MPRPAAFLDRDGTIIEDRHYLGDPEQVRLLPGAARAIARLNAAGVAAVVVTNQSGIARGYLSHEDYARVQARLDALLAAEGARLDAVLVCPHHPDITGPCECRKPGVQLHERAIAELGLDAARSAFVGDRWRDVEPALRFGGVGVLVAGRDTPAADLERARREASIASSLAVAVEWLLDTYWAPPDALQSAP